MSDSNEIQAAPIPGMVAEAVSTRPNVEMVFSTLLASGDSAAEAKP